MSRKMNVSLVSPSLSCNTNKLRHTKYRNRSRSWCFTINNHTPEILSHLSHPENWFCIIKKLAFQEELGENKTLHLQGVVVFANQVGFDRVKQFLPSAHIEKCKSVAASVRYCTKEQTRVGKVVTYGIAASMLNKKKSPPKSDDEIYDILKKRFMYNYDPKDYENVDLDI